MASIESISPGSESGGSFRNLLVWQKAFDLCVLVYRLTARLPEEEKYGLVSQMRRASVSIPANVAEGRARSHPREYAQSLGVAFGSAAELETYLLLARELHHVTDERDYEAVMAALVEVKRMLSGLRNRIVGKKDAGGRTQQAGHSKHEAGNGRQV